MHIKEIYIQNFKGFEQKKFSFNPQFNVAIGNNATGKSTLLHAIQVALGAYLQCLDIPANPSYRRQFKKSGERFVQWNDQLLDYLPKDEETKVDIAVEFGLSKSTIRWTRKLTKGNETTHSRATAGELITAVQELMKTRNSGENVLLPLVANFGTDRKASEFRKVEKANSKRTRLEKGYLTSLKEDTNFNGALEWIYNYDYNRKKKIEFEGTKEAFYTALHTALPYLKEIDYNQQYNQFQAEIDFDHVSFGRVMHSNMSDGLKSMLYMVAELAYRCVILNGFKGENAVLETEGIVLIDELDMHLHPNWQKHVVHDLKSAFPKLQFVVTTHSPFIVQSLSKDELINLDEIHANLTPKDQPLNKVVTEIMGVQNINSDDFEERHKLSLKVLEKLAEQPGEIKQDDYQTLKKIIDEVLISDTSDPVYKAYLEVKKAYGV